MKVLSLNLANFRGFEQIEMAFDPDVTLIAGVNGVGKSGILQALATLFSRALLEFTPSTAKSLSFTDEDIHHAKPSLEVSVSFTVAEQRCYANIQRVRGSDEGGDLWNHFWLSEQEAIEKLGSFAEIMASRTLTGDLEAARRDISQKLNTFKSRPNQPIVVYFSPRRKLPGRPRKLDLLKAFEVANAYGFALQDREVELRDIMNWFRWVETEADKAYLHGQSVLDKLRKVVNLFVPEFHNLHIEESPVLRFVVEKNGTPLALNQLSDGERGLLAILFDITKRLSIANPELDDPITDGAGIILIDEIELHLHPLWQRQVLRRFKEIFANCQFIATTHSPLVIGEVEARGVRFLDRDEHGRIVCTVPSEAYGLDANRVLEELMGARVRTEEIENRLQKLFELIDKEDFDAARNEISDLQMKMGHSEPELTRASSLIKFLKGDQ